MAPAFGENCPLADEVKIASTDCGAKVFAPAAFSPIVLLQLVFLPYLLVPAFGKYLEQTAMNVTHIAYFGLAFYHFSKSSVS